MRTIWKFEVPIPGKVSEVEMPKKARLLMGGIDNKTGHFCIWAAVDPEAEKEVRRFMVCGTGEDLPYANEMRHINSFQTGPFVWHAFELHMPANPFS